MSELLTVSDLEIAKKHDTFHSEVITGKAGGVAAGASIDTAINPVTGQVQKTLPKILDDLDWSYVGLFADGVTFTEKTDFAVDSVGTQWIYTGSLPFSATAGTMPSEPTYQAVHVRDHNSLSARNAAGAHDASAIEYINRTVAAKLGDFVSVKDFGAVGDGLTDDTSAFLAARAASVNVFIPTATVGYVLNSDVEGNFFGNSDVIFRGSGFITYTNTARTYEPQKFRCIAHRGYAGSVAENTLAAFSTAIRNGADVLETDVQITSDGVAVLYHDSTLDAQTNGAGTVASKTFAEISALNYDKLAGTPLSDAKIPTFNDMLTLAVKNNIPVFAEIKGYRTIDDIDIVLTSIVSTRANDLVTIIVNSFAELSRIRSSTNLLAGTIPIAIAYADQNTWEDKYFEARALGGIYEFVMYHVNITGGGAGMVKKINKYSRLNAYMLVNTGATNPNANSAQIALNMARLGVNSITSDQNIKQGV